MSREDRGGLRVLPWSGIVDYEPEILVGKREPLTEVQTEKTRELSKLAGKCHLCEAGVPLGQAPATLRVIDQNGDHRVIEMSATSFQILRARVREGRPDITYNFDRFTLAEARNSDAAAEQA